MNSNDIKAWKDLLDHLQSASSQNDVVITEIREEVKLQKQRNKKEVQKLAGRIKSQTESLEALLDQLDNGELFCMPSDQEALNAFRSTLQARLEESRQLLAHSSSMLNAATTSETAMEKIVETAGKAEKERTVGYVPKHFRKDFLLGNWIHNFTDTQFTCQSFWDDGAFREYDFNNGKLVEEREGKFDVEDGIIFMRYSHGKNQQYIVTGFSDDFVDYSIEGTQVRFDYMPEELLNHFLDEN